MAFGKESFFQSFIEFIEIITIELGTVFLNYCGDIRRQVFGES